MRLFFLFLVFNLNALTFEELPMAHNGRFRPVEVLKKEDVRTLKLLPSRYNKGEWLPLQALEWESENFTLYPDPLFLEIQKAYLLQKDLTPFLDEGYTPLAGKPYLKSHAKSLYYPEKWQLKLERFYLRYPLVAFCLFGYFLTFLLLIATKKGRALFYATFLLHTFLLVARCLILNRPPVSNMAETLLYVPWIAAAIALFSRKTILMAVSSFAAFSLLSLLSLSPLSSDMETVQPVLDSQLWLTVHVLMVVGSYGVFILSGLIAHLYLLRPKEELAKLILQTLYLGVALLITGTVLGGVWAAQSWGRFWDWDPKESWAFISSCLYLITIHAYTFGKIGNKGLAIGAIVGLQAITFTWYGVNFLLGTGLHSYGFGSGGTIYYLAFVAFEVLFLAPSLKFNRS